MSLEKRAEMNLLMTFGAGCWLLEATTQMDECVARVCHKNESRRALLLFLNRARSALVLRLEVDS